MTSGSKAISGSEIQLYVAGTDGVGSSARPLLTNPVRTDVNGKFLIPDTYTCPSPNSKIYVTAKGGNPGLAAGLDSSAILLMTMLGPCEELSKSADISINEVTTVGSVVPLSQFMSSIAKIGSSPSDSRFPEAVSRITQLVDKKTGVSPGTGVPDGYSVPTSKLNALANVLAACVDSPGGSAGDGSLCGALFTLATPPGGEPPSDTAMAALRISLDPTINVAQLFSLVEPTTAPFQPGLSEAPTDWNLGLIADTASQKTLFISLANAVIGITATGTVSIPSPAAAAVTVSLTSNLPRNISVSPSKLTIAKGETSTSFSYKGAGGGVATVTATASGYGTGIRRVAGIPATPAFSLASGNYTVARSLTLTSTSGSLIHYTLNGTSPTTSSPVYTKALVVGSTMSVRAIASLGGQLSSVGSATYMFANTGYHLIFTTQPPRSVAGTSFAPVVRVVDASGGLIISSAAITLSLSSNPNNATLSGIKTVSAVNGSAAFPGISVSAAGTGYTLSATSSGIASAISSAFAIRASSSSSSPSFGFGYYVANSGSDTNSGTSASAPWKTLAKLNATKMIAGNTAYLQCGSTFRETMTLSNAGTASLPLSYTSYGTCTGSNQPVLSGADLLSVWTAERNGLFTTYYASETATPTVVFEDDRRLPLVPAKLLLTKGTSFHDPVNKRVYVRTLEDANPTNLHTIEANVRSSVVTGFAISHVRIKGLEMDKAANIAVLIGGTLTDFQLINTVTNYSKAAGIYFTANTGQTQSNVLIKGCQASFNGLGGVLKGNGGDNFIIDGCTANYDSFDPAYTFSGALRLVSDGSTDANRVTNSGIQNSTAGWAGVNPDTGVAVAASTYSGVGVWCDTCGSGSFLLHNISHHSVQAGVQMEFSGTVGSRTMAYNVSYGNYWGILHTRRSHNDIIANNTSWNNLVNCQFSGEYGGGDRTVGMVNNTYENNICASQVRDSGGTVFVAVYGAENNRLGQGSGNIYRNNSFGIPSATNGVFALYGAGRTVSSYATLNIDYGGSMNSMVLDPLLKSPSTGIFTLQPGSPAIGAGVAGIDIGAY